MIKLKLLVTGISFSALIAGTGLAQSQGQSETEHEAAPPEAVAPHLPAPAADQYWEISKTVVDTRSSAQKLPNMYWRTHVIPGESKGESRVEIYDLCNGDKLAFNATGDKFEWSIKSNEGSQTGKVDDQGNLVINTDEGKEYATGHAIEKIACKDGVPTEKPTLVVPKWDKPIQSSGAAHLESAVGKTLMVTRPRSPTPGRPETSERIPAGTLVCKGAPMTEEAVRSLTDSPALALNPQLWPGNLIRGKDLSEGPQAKFTPITIRRGPATLSITGVNFSDPDAQVSIDIDRVSEANVKQAIRKLVSQPISSTEAVIAFDTKQVYSNEQLAFELGVDGRYTNASFNSSLKVDTNSKKNYVLARFQQIYYTVSFEDPESRYSVFEKEDAFKDPENQIGADNPPLYVKQVGYGRAVYFLASSTDSGTAVKAALEGAYGNKDAGNYIGVNAEMDYKKVMSNTSISYYVLGGNAEVMLQPIKAATPEKMYDAIKQVIADAKAAQVSQFSTGLPISYSLNYLTSRSPASMGYSTSYDLTECKIYGTTYYSFQIEHTCVDDYVDVNIKDPQASLEWTPVTHWDGSHGHKITNLDLFTKGDDKDYTLQIKEYNIAGPSCNDFMIKRMKADEKDPKVIHEDYLQGNGATFGPIPHIFKDTGNSWLVGTRSDWQMKFNRQSGAAQVIRQGS